MHTKLQQDIDDLGQSIVHQQEVAGPHALEKSEEHLREVEAEIMEVTADDAYQRHLGQYLAEQADAFQAGARETRLCSCNDPYCPLKQGRLPAEIRMAESKDRGLRGWLERHRGDGKAIHDAREDWYETCSRLKAQLREALVILRRDERPDEEADASA